MEMTAPLLISNCKPNSRLTIIAAALCAAILFASHAGAQDWKQVSSTGPPVRNLHDLAYDSAREVVVLFGGWTGYGDIKDDTWEWDGSTWTERFPATVPPARLSHAMAYDSARGVVVLFAGQPDTGGMPNDTWEWDGTDWTQRFPTDSPGKRYGHAMAYDSARGVTVLFGGFSGSTSLNDTWEWDGTNWIERFPTYSPSTRDDFGMAYDEARGKVVLFGGYTFNGSSWILDTSTYEWDGNAWAQISVSGPSGREKLAMAYDSVRQRVVLFGGSVSSDYFGDTWEWDGSSWTQVSSTGPNARHRHAMTYDSARRKIVLFGGRGGGPYLGDTWEYRPAYDLKAKFKKASANAVRIGGRLRLIARVKNIGEANSLPTTVYFYLSTDRKLDEDDILLGGKAIQTLAPGVNQKIKMKFTVPAIIDPGFYYVIVQVVAADAKPRNNVSASRSTIQIY